MGTPHWHWSGRRIRVAVSQGRANGMKLLSKKDLTGYFVELIVVVLGILIAFQVDEWRDNLQIERDLQAALVRLKEETQSNLRECEGSVPFRARLARSVQLVLQSIQSGSLRDTDIGEFEYGLTHIGFLPRNAYLSTVAEEMIATGLLKRLDNAGLQTKITSAQAQIEIFHHTITTQSRLLLSSVDELARAVKYSYAGTSDLDELRNFAVAGVFEDGINVSYDLASLANNLYLRNLLVETTDGHIDLYSMDYYICVTIEEIDDHLVELGIE